MKNLYAFVLGKNNLLSLAEIVAFFKKEGIFFEIIDFSKEVAVLRIDLELIIDSKFIDNLGGTIKIIKIGQENDLVDITDFRKIIRSRDLGLKSRKIRFGLSLYDLNCSKKTLKRIENSLKAISLNLKKELKNEGRKAGFVIVKERNLSSVSVLKNELLKENGIEIDIIASKKSLYIGKTLAVQDFESYSFRDYGRPSKDLLSGMTPPKLAKMMINLAKKPKKAVLLDPFCGSGTFIQEMILSEYRDIYASDVSERAVSDTKKNIEWLFEKFKIPKKELNLNIFKKDVRDLSEVIKENSIDAVIGESYLGPAQKKALNEKEIYEIFLTLTPLYLDSLKIFQKLIKNDGVVVLALPAFNLNNHLFLSPIDAELDKLGFEVTNPLNGMANLSEISKRKTFIYFRKDQKVLREILILKLK